MFYVWKLENFRLVLKEMKITNNIKENAMLSLLE